MRKYGNILILFTLIVTQQVFANPISANTGKNACDAIAKRCLAGGFTQRDYPTKRFWQDCMKPVLMNQEVVDITVDPKLAAACRAERIQEIKTELSELQNAAKAGH